MPYIPEASRHVLDRHLGSPVSSGELNYAFTREICTYLRVKNLSYQTINDIIGALEAAKAEFYRRVAIPYEDKKIIENGDVYGDII